MRYIFYSLTGFDGYKADPDSHPKKRICYIFPVEHCNSRNTISYVQANVRNPSFQFSVHRKTAAQRQLKTALLQNSACPSTYSQSDTCFPYQFDLTDGNWQKWKRVFLICHCHKIYRDEAVGLKSCKNTWKITIFVKMWNLGQYRENLIFCQ